MELSISNVTKQFKHKTAVDNVSITLTTGAWGLIGANGAGKTTLMRIVAGVLTPTQGQVMYNGVDIHLLGEKYRSQFGYLPQKFGFYPEFSVYDYLSYVSALKNLDKHAADKRIDELLELVGLSDVKKKAVRKLSGGMQRRVGIAQALLNNPKVLILDEPTSGLDPGERVRFRNIISELAQDRIVLISTHIVADVEYIATCNALMKDGKLIAFDTTDELNKLAAGVVWSAVVSANQISAIEKRIRLVNIKNDNNGHAHIRYLSETALYEGSVMEQPKLEDLYLWLFRE